LSTQLQYEAMAFVQCIKTIAYTYAITSIPLSICGTFLQMQLGKIRFPIEKNWNLFH